MSRRITLPKERRINNVKIAINRSGFTGPEILQLLADWYGWSEVQIVHNGVRKIITSNNIPSDLLRQLNEHSG